MRLTAAADAVRTAAAALKTSEDGRRVALHPGLVRLDRQLYEVNLPVLPPAADIDSRLEVVRRIELQIDKANRTTFVPGAELTGELQQAAAADLTQRLEAVRRVERQLADALGTTHLPEPELAVLPQNAAVWADQEARRVARVRDLLAVLIREGEVKLPPPATPAADLSLDQALRQLAEAESAQRQRLFVERTGAAQAEAHHALAEAEAAKIRAAAKTEGDRILAEARAEARRVEAETQARLEAAEQESQLERDRLAAELKEKAAAQERARELAAAAQDHAATTNRLAQERLRDDARKLELRKRAADPTLQAKLAPFLTPGLWQLNGYSLEEVPFSFTALQACGALTPSGQGLQALLDIATSPRDRVRPRWDNSVRVNWKGRPERQGQIVEAQQLLTELGTAFVELGLLRE